MPFGGSFVATISAGIPVGTGGKRGPSTGVRISATRQRSPLVLSPEQVQLGLAELEFRDQLLVFLEGALGIRQGELGALRWVECDFDNMSISVQHSYYWRRGGNLKGTKTEASAKLLPMHPSLKQSLQEWRSQKPLQQTGRFRVPFRKTARQQAVGSSLSIKEEDSACIQTNRNYGCGLAHVSTLGWNDASGDGRNINSQSATTCGTATFDVTNKYLQATSKTKRLAQDKLVDAILPTGKFPKTNLIQ
jgi:integrase